MPYRKKLIEVALPLEAINAESAREKSIPCRHPHTLRQLPLDINARSCYKIGTSPLFLRGQGARRSTAASAFLSLSVFSKLPGKV